MSGRPGRMRNHLTDQDRETKAVHKPTEVDVFKAFQTAEQQQCTVMAFQTEGKAGFRFFRSTSQE